MGHKKIHWEEVPMYGSTQGSIQTQQAPETGDNTTKKDVLWCGGYLSDGSGCFSRSTPSHFLIVCI